MITPEERATILAIAGRYGDVSLWLFGSDADPNRSARDIDLAVDNLPATDFFRFYGELILSLARPVDLVDLSKPSRFTDLIRREGIRLV